MLRGLALERRRVWRGVALVVVLSVVGLVDRMGRGQEPSPAERIEAGRRVFAGSCGMAYCHGTDGVGGTAPRLRDRDYTAERLTQIIKEGIPGTAMPAFGRGLDREQIGQLVAFLLSVNREVRAATEAGRVDPHFGGGGAVAPVASAGPSVESHSPRRSGESDGGFSGDWRAGEQLFFDAASLSNCRVCHTLHGRGGKVASDLTRLSGETPGVILRSLLLPRGAADGRHGLVTLRLAAGGQVTGILRDEDEKSVRVFDTSTMPPVSRNYLRGEILGIDRLSDSGCQGRVATSYTFQQTLDLVALIRTTDPSSPARVELGDLLR
jgi:mono/diheme cytochrome c family protein